MLGILRFTQTSAPRAHRTALEQRGQAAVSAALMGGRRCHARVEVPATRRDRNFDNKKYRPSGSGTVVNALHVRVDQSVLCRKAPNSDQR